MGIQNASALWLSPEDIVHQPHHHIFATCTACSSCQHSNSNSTAALALDRIVAQICRVVVEQQSEQVWGLDIQDSDHKTQQKT